MKIKNLLTAKRQHVLILLTLLLASCQAEDTKSPAENVEVTARSAPAQTYNEPTPVAQLHANTANYETNILVLGDSLSAGFGLERQENGWVNLMRHRLNEQDYDIGVVNASISGDTSQGGASRIKQALALHSPEIVVIELGGNDGLRGIGIDVMQQNFASMIQASQSAGAKVILLEMRIPPNYGQRYTDEFHNAYQKLAADYGVSLVPFFLVDVALNQDLMQSDGIHPNDDAQPLMLERVWPAIVATISKHPSNS